MLNKEKLYLNIGKWINDKKEGLFIVINNSEGFNNRNNINASFNGKNKNTNYNSNLSIQYNQSFNSNLVEKDINNEENNKNINEKDKLHHIKANMNNSIYNSIKKNKFDSFSGENFVIKNQIPGIPNFVDILNDYNMKISKIQNENIQIDCVEENDHNILFNNSIYEGFFIFSNDKPVKDIFSDSIKNDKKLLADYYDLINFFNCVYDIYNGDLL